MLSLLSIPICFTEVGDSRPNIRITGTTFGPAASEKTDNAIVGAHSCLVRRTAERLVFGNAYRPALKPLNKCPRCRWNHPCNVPVGQRGDAVVGRMSIFRQELVRMG